jgi:hypothetical protein
MKGRTQDEEGFLSLVTIETWIAYVWHSEGEWARQKIFYSIRLEVLLLDAGA